MWRSAFMRCFIPLKGGHRRVVNLPKRTFKVERENGKAMTQGYRRRLDDSLYYVSMYTSGDNAVALNLDFDAKGLYTPKVLSYRTSQEPRYPVSRDGFDMGVSDYKQPFTLPHKYVAILNSIVYIDKEFHTERGMELWGALCNNGIFDIWEPAAPYHRLIGDFDLDTEKQPIMKPQILLLRIFELDRALAVEHQENRTDLVVGSSHQAPLTLKGPIIPYDDGDESCHGFRGKYTLVDIGNRILKTLEDMDAPHEEVLVNDTSQIEVPT
jgi:hypothetical protein